MLCPICKGELEVRSVAPCYDCGHSPDALTELSKGDQEYHLLKIYGQELVLCTFCVTDFDSYEPEYLGLPEECANNYPLERISTLESPVSAEDRFCPKCDHRLAFLILLGKIRDNNAT